MIFKRKKWFYDGLQRKIYVKKEELENMRNNYGNSSKKRL
jgi:hypothetical protein